MRILFVTHRLPYPQVRHAGGRYQYRLIEALSDRSHEIDILSFTDETEVGHASDLRDQGFVLWTVPSAKSNTEKILDFWRYLVYPKFIADAYRRCFARKLRKVLRCHHYDIVHFEFTQMAQYAKYAVDKRRTLLEHDYSVRPVRRDYEGQPWGLMKLWKYWTLTLLRIHEPSVCRKFDIIFVYSTADRAAITAAVPDATVHVLTPPVPHDPGPKAPPTDFKILFVGDLGRKPNQEAVLWLYGQVFSSLSQRFPEAHLVLVGSQPTKEIRALSTDRRVTLHIGVDDVEPYYKTARVFVAPMKTGGGIIKKNLDALALGCPVVTTRVGNEGIGAPRNDAVLVCETASEFQDAIARIGTDDSLWIQLSSGSRFFVGQRFNWDTTVDCVIKDFRRLSTFTHSTGDGSQE